MKSLVQLSLVLAASITASCGQNSGSSSSHLDGARQATAYRFIGTVAYSPTVFADTINSQWGVFEINTAALFDKSVVEKCRGKKTEIVGPLYFSQLTRGMIVAITVKCAADVVPVLGDAFSGNVFYRPIDGSYGIALDNGSTHYLDDSIVRGTITADSCDGKRAVGRGQFFQANSPEGAPNANWIKIFAMTCN